MFRVATFNIHHGARAVGAVDHRALVETCAELDADVLGLQEVDDRRLRSLFRNQAALVGRRLGYTVVYGTVLRTGAIGRYGNALLARGAVRDVDVVRLARPSRRQARGAVIARVELPDGNLTAAITHLQHHPTRLRDEPREAPVQLASLLDALTHRPPPQLLLGDLNLGRDRAVPLLEAAGFAVTPDEPTFPAHHPRVTLDYIAVAGLRVVETRVVATRTSDHRAVVATLTMTEA